MPEPAKHTPGPLIACRCPKPDITIAPVDRGTLWLVRRNDGKHCGEVAITQGQDAEGNARLFAAAFDLLQACILALSVGEALEQPEDENRRIYLGKSTIAALRAAIAKATNSETY